MVEMFGKLDAKSTTTAEPVKHVHSDRWTPCLTVEKADWSWADENDCEWMADDCGGSYKSFCRRHQGGFQGYAKRVSTKNAYTSQAA